MEINLIFLCWDCMWYFDASAESGEWISSLTSFFLPNALSLVKIVIWKIAWKISIKNHIWEKCRLLVDLKNNNNNKKMFSTMLERQRQCLVVIFQALSSFWNCYYACVRDCFEIEEIQFFQIKVRMRIKNIKCSHVFIWDVLLIYLISFLIFQDGERKESG